MASVLILRIFAPKFTHHSGRNPSQKKRGQTLPLWQQPQQTSKWCSQKSCFETRLWPQFSPTFKAITDVIVSSRVQKKFLSQKSTSRSGRRWIRRVEWWQKNVEKSKKDDACFRNVPAKRAAVISGCAERQTSWSSGSTWSVTSPLSHPPASLKRA